MRDIAGAIHQLRIVGPQLALHQVPLLPRVYADRPEMRLGQRESAREKRFLASELRLRVEQPYRLFINRPVGSANSRPVHHLRMWWERLQQGPVAPSLAEPIQAALAHTTALVTRCSEVAAPTRRLVGS